MNIRTVILLTIMSILLLGIVGCPGTQTGEKVTLNMWIMPNSTEPLNDINKVLKGFKATHPNIDVKVTSLDWGSAWTKITTAATSGDTPDIVQIGSTWVGSISSMGALIDLKDKVSELGGKDAFVPAAWATAGVIGKGEVTAIPWFVDARAIYYRTDVFNKLGLTEKDLEDWDSFLATLKKIKAANLTIEGKKIQPLGIPGKNDWNVIHSIAPWIWSAGGSFISKDNKKSDLDTEGSYKGSLFYVDLVVKGFVPIECLELNTAQVSTAFNNGNYAMYVDGPYEIKTLTLPPERGGASESISAKNFAVCPYPKGPEGRVTFIGGSNLSIFAASKYKDEAWELVKYLVSKKPQVEYAKLTAFLPARLESFEDPYFTKDRHRKVFKDAVKYGRTYPCISSWGLVEPILTRRLGIMWDYVAENTKSFDPKKIREQLKLAAKELNSVITE